MNRIKTAVVLLALVLPLVLMPLAMAVPAQPQVQLTIEQIGSDVQEIRGLTLKNPIQVGFMDREELRAKLIAEFDEDWPAEDRQTDQEIMVMFGFLEPDDDLYRILLELLTEQILGFYDAEDKELYLISGEETLSATDRLAIAHEISHALQDQYFNLDQPPFDVDDSHDDDAMSATTALIEGDAMRVTNRYALSYLDTSDLTADDLESSEDQLASAPTYIRDSLLFPYVEGEKFVQEKGRSNERAYALFRNPPVSTEQILHPELYPSDTPTAITMDDMSEALGQGWSQEEYNTIGEFDVYQLFKPYLPSATARQAAAGWDGTLYHYYVDGGDGKLLVQSYAWDSGDDADEFAEAFVEYLPERFPGATWTTEGNWTRWEAGGYHFGLKTDGDRTEVVQSNAAAAASTAIATLGQEDTTPDGNAEDGQENEHGRYDWLAPVLAIALAILFLALAAVVLLLRRRGRRARAGAEPPSGPPVE
ncbi:MAG: hypothetical protein ACYC55_09175 [Candidatus Geothermincolia bacterium]